MLNLLMIKMNRLRFDPKDYWTHLAHPDANFLLT